MRGVLCKCLVVVAVNSITHYRYSCRRPKNCTDSLEVATTYDIFVDTDRVLKLFDYDRKTTTVIKKEQLNVECSSHWHVTTKLSTNNF